MAIGSMIIIKVMQIIMLKIFLIASLLGSSLAAVPNNIPDPKVIREQGIIEMLTQVEGHSFKVDLPVTNYEFSGGVFQSDKELAVQEIHNISKYQPSKSCQFYRTNMEIDQAQKVMLPQTIHKGFVLQKSKQIYCITQMSGHQKKSSLSQGYYLQRFVFDNKNITKKQHFVITQHILPNMQYDQFSFIQINNILYVSDGQALCKINAQNGLLPINGFVAQSSSFIQLGNYGNQSQFYALYSNKLIIYELINQDVKTIRTIENDKQIRFQDAHNDGCNKDLYILTEQKLLYDKNSITSQIEIDKSSCKRMQKHGLTLHLLCEIDRIRYIGQYLITKSENSLSLQLNRYYNDLIGYKYMKLIGYDKDKLIIIGDDQLYLTSYGVNRNMLLNLKSFNHQYFRSFLIDDLFVIQQFVNQLNTPLIAITNNNIHLFSLQQIPPQVICTFQSSQLSYQSIIVLLNTTQCQRQCMSTLNSVCSIQMPYRITLNTKQYQQSTTFTILIVVILIIAAAILFLVGCGLKYKTVKDRAIFEIKKKLQSIRSKRKQMKPI